MLQLSTEKAPTGTEAIHSAALIHTPFSLCLYLHLVHSKPAGVLSVAQGQYVEIHQHSKVPTL